MFISSNRQDPDKHSVTPQSGSSSFGKVQVALRARLHI